MIHYLSYVNHNILFLFSSCSSYEQLELDLGNNLFIFVYLTNEPSLSPSLGLNIKRDKLKYNNLFINKLVSI
jgi:hypothetical protein